MILITEKFSTEAFYQLKSNLSQVKSLHDFNTNISIHKLASTETILQFKDQIETLIIRSKTRISTDLISQLKKLKLIITCTSGFDHIDLEATQKNNITVMFTPEANAQSAAELTWSLVLASQRKIVDAHKSTKSGVWQRELFSGQELAGKTFGVVGLGRIGQKVLKMAQAFDMEILAFDPYQTDDVFQKFSITRSSYEELLKQCDILSFHVPLTLETQHMLKASHFEFVNRGLTIINTSRGGVIQEDDLCTAIEQGYIQFAALDVFEKEPLSRESKLLKQKNVLLTQHMGALTEQAFQKASLEACQLCENFYRNKATSNTLPLNNDWGRFMFKDEIDKKSKS